MTQMTERERRALAAALAARLAARPVGSPGRPGAGLAPRAGPRVAGPAGEGGPMSRRRGRHGRRPSGFTPPGSRELFNVILPNRGAEKRRFFNELADRVVVMIGVAAAVVGFGAGGPLGALAGLAAGLCAAARAAARGRYRRG